MSQALFLSDNELLIDVYSVNLSSYLDTNLKTVSKLQEVEALASKEEFDLLITLSTIAGDDVGLPMLKISEKLNLPLVVIGEKSQISNTPDVTTIPGNLNIQFFLRNIAKILGVTADDMASRVVGDYFPMALKAFLGMTNVPCDVFFKVSKVGGPEEFTKIWSEGQEIDSKFDKFKNLDILNLFIASDKRLLITNQVTQSISRRLTDKILNSDEKLEAVESGFELMAQSLFSNEEVTEEVLELSTQCIEVINSVIEQDPSLTDLLNSMMSKKTRFIYMHSVLTTYVCQYILEKISWGSKEHIEKVSYVLFFHDMFLVPVYNDHVDIKYEEDLVFSPDLTDKEKDIIINHAKEAGNALKRLPKCPMGADTIVTQHHGATNGVGFNMNPCDDVSPLSKVIIIGEAFVDEFLKTKDEGLTPDVSKINKDLLDRYSNKSYQKLIKTLSKIKL